MTSTSEITKCACNCGEIISQTDDHPWFKRHQCQQLWHAFVASGVPEADFVQWSWDQRFIHELWNAVPWRTGYWCDVLTDSHVISMANSMLLGANLATMREDGPESLVDAYLIASYYRHAEHDSLIWLNSIERIPKWARVKYHKNMWSLSESVAHALEQFGLERPAQDEPADLVAPA